MALAVAAAIASAHPVAADHAGQLQTFAQIVRQARLIVIARISVTPDGGVDLAVERVLKGEPVERLVFRPTDLAPPIEGWQRALFAFADPSTIDFRTPTTASHVADDGTIDPEGLQPQPDRPATLDAMLVAFGQDPSESVAAAAPLAPPAQGQPPHDTPSPLPAALLAAVVGLVIAVVLGRRLRKAQ